MQLQQSAEIEYEIAHIAKRQARAHGKHYKIPHPDGFRYALDLIPIEQQTNTDVETLACHQRAIKDCDASPFDHSSDQGL